MGSAARSTAARTWSSSSESHTVQRIEPPPGLGDRREPLGLGGEPLGVAGADRHVGAVGEEHPARRPPDATRAAGEEGSGSGQGTHPT